MEFNLAFRYFLLNVGLILILISILSTAKNDIELNHNILNGINVIPLHYDVKIKFNVYRNVFLGKCNITIQIKSQTKTIIINSKTIAMIKIDLIDNDDNQTINIQKYSFINKTYIHLDFTESSEDFLSPGTYTLRMTYVRTLFDDRNFFESFFTNKTKELNNESIKVIKARELFPCWDEPDDLFTSTFIISIWHHTKYTFLSNMPIRKQIGDFDDMVWTHFDKSPSILIQDLTIVLTTFTYYFTPATNGRFWYKKEMANIVPLANRLVDGVINYLKEKSTKKISKIDYFVIEDFQHSNIRMLGFILLRQSDIIYNKTIDHTARKMEVANLIARETISYWYHDVILWSKKGFITFLAAHILQQTRYYPTINLFVVKIQQDSLRFGNFSDSYLLNPANISTVYSFRSSFHYIKSFIMWRTLHHILSEKTFWIIINTYTNIQYNQRYTTDFSNLSSITLFWNIVENVPSVRNKIGNFNIKNVMWSIEEGYYFELFVTQNYFTNTTVITNINYNRTLLPGKNQYQLYVTYTTKSVMNFKTVPIELTDFWLFPLVPRYLIYDTADKNDWIILNLQQTGYYRVNYDLDNWQKLANYLYFTNYTHIHVLNRAQIIDDAFYFWMQKQLNFSMFLNITRFLLKDTDYVAWYPMIKAVEYIICIWPFQNTLIIKNKIDEMFDKLLQNIGYDDKVDDTDFTKCLREEAVKWACLLDNYKCIQTAAAQLEKHLENSVENKYFKWREWIYCKGSMLTNPNTYYKMLYKYKMWNTTDNYIYSEYLTCSRNAAIIEDYLKQIIIHRFYSTVANNQMIANIVLLIVAKHANNNRVLNFIFNNFESFKFSLKTQVDQIAILIIIITHKHDVYQLERVSEFVKNNLTMSDEQLAAVKQKIKKRKKENGRLIKKYSIF